MTDPTQTTEEIDHFVIEVLREWDFHAPQDVLDSLNKLYEVTP